MSRYSPALGLQRSSVLRLKAVITGHHALRMTSRVASRILYVSAAAAIKQGLVRPMPRG